MTAISLRWRKFSPIDRRFPIYELVDGDTVVLDVSRGDSGRLEVAFHDGARGRVIDLETLERMLLEAKNCLLLEEPD